MSDLNRFLSSDRRNFTQQGLNENELPAEPAELFLQWLKLAVEKQNPEPYAFVLMTSADGVPSGRIVYLRGLEDDGSLVFFTNYLSEKGEHLSANAHAGALFFWPFNERQVRITGKAQKCSAEVSDAYFASRPRESQIGAWASKQSALLGSRQELEEQVAALRNKFESSDEIPRPDFWGGYQLTPSKYEFWEGRESRLHDRIRYRKKESGVWTVERLSP